MHTLSFSVTLQWCWSLNSNCCWDWKSFKVPKKSFKVSSRDSQVSPKSRSHLKIQGTRMVTLIKFHPADLLLFSPPYKMYLLGCSGTWDLWTPPPNYCGLMVHIGWLCLRKQRPVQCAKVSIEGLISGMFHCKCKTCDSHLESLNINLFKFFKRVFRSCSNFSVRKLRQTCKFKFFPVLSCFNTIGNPKNVSYPRKWFVRLKLGNLMCVCAFVCCTCAWVVGGTAEFYHCHPDYLCHVLLL